jgi:hypothetical protein
MRRSCRGRVWMEDFHRRRLGREGGMCRRTTLVCCSDVGARDVLSRAADRAPDQGVARRTRRTRLDGWRASSALTTRGSTSHSSRSRDRLVARTSKRYGIRHLRRRWNGSATWPLGVGGNPSIRSAQSARKTPSRCISRSLADAHHTATGLLHQYHRGLQTGHSCASIRLIQHRYLHIHRVRH